MGAEGDEGDDASKQELAGYVALDILRFEDRQAIKKFGEAQRESEMGSPETPETAFLSRDPGMFRQALEAFARLRTITKKVLRGGRDM